MKAAARMQFAITVSAVGRDWSLALHDSCLAYKLYVAKHSHDEIATIDIMIFCLPFKQVADRLELLCQLLAHLTK